ALEAALTEIVRRHEVLRTTLGTGEAGPIQRIAPPPPVSLPLVDLSALAAPAREAEIEQQLAHAAAEPFDLGQGPLFRARLLRLEEAEHLLLLTFHHVICDGWSLGVLQRELAALYPAFVAGQAPPLPELPLQYADFALWQRDWL